MVKFRPSWAKLRGSFSGGRAHKVKEWLVGMVQVVFQQPAEMETLGGPHAVEQKQTNGLGGESSVARRGGRRDSSPEIHCSLQ